MVITEPEKLSYEQLLELVRALAAENAELRAELERLNSSGRSAAPFSKNKRQQKRKRPGRKPGQGSFSYRPAPPAESYTSVAEVPVAESVCPACGGELAAAGTEMVTNTELPELPKPSIKAYRIFVCRCLKCGRRVRGQHPEVAPSQHGATAHRLGPRAHAAAQLLHHQSGVPLRQVPRVLKTLTGLSLTQSALTQAALRAGSGTGRLAQAYAELRAELKQQPVINTDDTGWRVGGERAHQMAFESATPTLYQIRPQHRNQEVREVIGDDYAGVLATDRGKSYDAKELTSVKQQKCLGHLQRSIAQVLERKRGMARFFGEVLKAQLKDAILLHRSYPDPATRPPADQQRVEALAAEISYHLRPRLLTDSDNQRLLNELGWPHDRGNLLRFLHEPGLEPTNNAAERALRPAVIARKVSHCSKTEKGATAYAAFKSVMRTMIKRGSENILESLTRLLDPSLPPAPT